MSAITKSNTRGVIAMPIEFQETLFNTSNNQEFLTTIFNGDTSDSDMFMRLLNENSRRLGHSITSDSWALAEVVNDEDVSRDAKYLNFFFYPKDDSRTYFVDGSRFPVNDEGERDGIEYDDVEVDNKLFGLIASLATFDCDHTRRDLASIYMDRGQDLNECVIESYESLNDYGYDSLRKLNVMMAVICPFLRYRWENGTPYRYKPAIYRRT